MTFPSAPVVALLLAAAAAFTAVGVVTPNPIASRILPWVEPGWRLQPARNWRGRLQVSSVKELLARHSMELLTAAFVFAMTAIVVRDALVAVVMAATTLAAGAKAKQTLRERRQRAMSAQIAAEVPEFADYMALCLSSGISIDAALERAHQNLQGHLSSALHGATEQRRNSRHGFLHAGSEDARNQSNPVPSSEGSLPLSAMERLSACAQQSGSVPLRQFIDAVRTSDALGTPLAEVLLAQAQQLRAVRQQQLLALSGRREVLMLIPIVFIIFPVVVAVALFPAWAQLNGSLW